jgi:hypothetical protein
MASVRADQPGPDVCGPGKHWNDAMSQCVPSAFVQGQPHIQRVSACCVWLDLDG